MALFVDKASIHWLMGVGVRYYRHQQLIDSAASFLGPYESR